MISGSKISFFMKKFANLFVDTGAEGAIILSGSCRFFFLLFTGMF